MVDNIPQDRLLPIAIGRGNESKAQTNAANIKQMITVPHLTSEGGISPRSCLTFSERSSIFASLLSFGFSISYIYLN